MKHFRLLLVSAASLTGIFGALATRAGNAAAPFKYGIDHTDATYYYVASNITGEVKGVGYVCNVSTNVCSILSNNTPDSQGRILKTAATVLDNNGDFVNF